MEVATEARALCPGVREADRSRASGPPLLGECRKHELPSRWRICTFSPVSSVSIRSGVRHAPVMGDAELDRLRKEIRYRFANSPHKKKLWLALLDMHGHGLTNAADGVRPPECAGIRRAAVNPSMDAAGKTSCFSRPLPMPTRSGPRRTA